MAATTTFAKSANRPPSRKATSESLGVKVVLVGITLSFVALFLLFPLVIIFQGALVHGWGALLDAYRNENTQSAIKLTLLVAAVVVPLNTLFGVGAAWCLTRYHFRGRALLITLIDLPLWVSPVVGGLIYVLVYGIHGWVGEWLSDHGIRIIFAVPGIVLATVFVTFPFVARGLIPLMQAQGMKEEEAALTLGANGWQIFWRVTVPKIKWGLLYGIILCNARAMGEFGAVSVVSGHIQGKTNTMPLDIELLYNNREFVPAFAVAALLALLALLTLVIKTHAEWKAQRQLAHALEIPK